MTVESGGMTPDGLSVVELSFESFAQFQEEYASYLSHEGLFIKTEELYPPASMVRFRIRLPHDLVLAEGDGVVVWTRQKGHPSGGVPGIAVRFISLPLVRAYRRTIPDAIIPQNCTSVKLTISPKDHRAASIPPTSRPSVEQTTGNAVDKPLRCRVYYMRISAHGSAVRQPEARCRLSPPNSQVVLTDTKAYRCLVSFFVPYLPQCRLISRI